MLECCNVQAYLSCWAQLKCHLARKLSQILSEPEAVFLFLNSLNTNFKYNGTFYFDIELFLLHMCHLLC